MPTTHLCTGGCGKRITWRFAICSDCEKKYGKRTADWPDWLAYTWRDTARERRSDARSRRFETSFEDESDFEFVDE